MQYEKPNSIENGENLASNPARDKAGSMRHIRGEAIAAERREPELRPHEGIPVEAQPIDVMTPERRPQERRPRESFPVEYR